MIKVRDIAFVRFGAPDLDAMERFLVDFGLVMHGRDGDRLFMRGTDPVPYVHVTERGEPGFRGLALEAASAEDLASAAELPGASDVEPIDAPGGGRRVRFTDPDGHAIEVVHGREAVPALPIRAAGPLNTGSRHPRLRTLQRVPRGPACVKRLGHAVLRVTDFRRSEAWYKSRFGFLSSDEVWMGSESNVVTAFMRCDRGTEPTDHHTLLCLGLGDSGFDHAAFEVEDFDSVMAGHDHLALASRYEHHAGVGRHILGSQVFDYWRDPWGHVLEHFTDGDLLDASHPTGLHDVATALGTQWGRFA